MKAGVKLRKLRVLCIAAFLVILTVLLAGCGANVSTTMNIDTADGGFAGSRVMTLLITNEDLEKVTGGITGLETVIKESIPSDLSYSISYPSETESQITFTLSFSSLEDYKTKVTNLLAANANNEIVAEISYEKDETLFRKGLKFIENFQTVDLLKWYQNALETANIISESSSNWYEHGTDTLIVDEEKLDTYGSRYDYDKVVTRYLDSCEVKTVMNMDGTYDRTITFKANEYTLEKLQEVTDDLAGYMKGIAPEGVTFATQVDEDGYYTLYTYTMTGLSVEDMLAKTNAVLQTQDNTFAVTIAPKEGVAGTAVITIEESLDSSYYMDREYDSVRSTVVTYPNFSLTEGNASTNYNKNEIYYYVKTGETYTMTGDWLVGYKKVELKLKATGLTKLTAELVLSANEALAEDIRNIAFSAVEAACKDRAEYSKDGSVATCKFSGTAEEVAAKLDAFIKVYAPVEEGSEQMYSDAYVKEMATASKFTSGLYGAFEVDLSPVLGNINVYVSGEKGTQVVDQLETDDIGAYTDSHVSVRFYGVNMNFGTLILAVIFALLLIAGVVLAIINREGFAQWVAELQQKKANKQAAMYYQQQPAAPVPDNGNYQQPAADNSSYQQPVAAPTEYYAPAQAEADEEEIL